MELSQHGLLEDLLAPRRDPWTTFLSGVNESFPNGWSFESFDESPVLATASLPFLGLTSQTEPSLTCPFTEIYPFPDGFITVPEIDHPSLPYDTNDKPSLPVQEPYPSTVDDDGELCLPANDLHSPKVEMEPPSHIDPVFNMGFGGERKSRVKKIEGQPSKNLMAERRRRKRLNDRLSMLRSIVPKISKMDRTSILGDTIDYMKELLDKISKLQGEEAEAEAGIDQVNLMGNFNDFKPNELLLRNSPKFDVEKRNIDTRIEICCAAKPGLLLSTVKTLEALGFDIQQCVVSCFSDFSMQASCLEAAEQRTSISSEDIKQALFRNAGYGGKCQ